MINVIYGLKGSGKTNKIIDKANWRAAATNGSIVYITDRPEHSREIDKSIRFININEYEICCESTLLAFIKGLFAGNYDITDVYIDGPAKFVKSEVGDMENFYKGIEAVSDKFKADFTVTVSVEEVPDYMKKYL